MHQPERSSKKEFIDSIPPNYTYDEYNVCIDQLGLIGKWLGGDIATLYALRELNFYPKSILDVGCGGGHLTRKIALAYKNTDVEGIEINPWAIDYALNRLHSQNIPNLRFNHRRNKTLSEPENSVDIVLCSLVCHHMTDDEIVTFLKQAASSAQSAIVINDLHRHRFASILFAIIAPVFFRNRLIVHDGLLSIKRSFIYRDWEFYLSQAGFSPEQWTIYWRWAFRWIITIRLS